MRIADWPEGERPRERLLAQGAGALTDAELIALCLRTGVRGMSAVDLGRDLLARHGGLAGLLGASHRELARLKGMGTAKAALPSGESSCKSRPCLSYRNSLVRASMVPVARSVLTKRPMES